MTRDLMQRRVDIPLLVADDLHLDVGWQLGRDPSELGFDVADNCDTVGSRLAANLERDCRRTVQMGQRTLLFGPILDPANVANLDGRAVDICDDEFFHIARVGKTPERSQNQFTPPRLDVSARHVCVLSLQSVAHRGDGKFVSCQPLRIDPDIDRALQTTNDVDLADTFGTLELRTNDFVAVFGQLAKRSLTRK